MLQEKTMLDIKQIVLETVEEYADPNKRAMYVNKDGLRTDVPQYEDINGNKCAVGRCMTKKAIEKYASSCKEVQAIAYAETNNPINIDPLLKPEYQGHGYTFWSKLQDLHDTERFWSEDGITEKGIEYIMENFDIEI